MKTINLMKTIVVATKNKGKLRELEKPLQELGFLVEVLPDTYADIPEDFDTFEENALFKARFVCKDKQKIALADDSGLAVAYLDGKPGVFSARYGDDIPLLPAESKDSRNIRKLLLAMKEAKDHERSCAFHCAMALVFPDGRELVVHETWEGRLLAAPCGDHGFGYDPIFYDENYKMSASQMENSLKMSCSHRGKALASLMNALKLMSS